MAKAVWSHEAETIWYHCNHVELEFSTKYHVYNLLLKDRTISFRDVEAERRMNGVGNGHLLEGSGAL